jgi:hypothetical protein
MNFDPSLPFPHSEAWRENYGFGYNGDKRLFIKDRSPLVTSYQAPGRTAPVPFAFDSLRFSGGQSVDTAEYPFFEYWSTTPLNEKPHSITVTGFIRGDAYIKGRNALVEALRVRTGDDAPGFLDLPLWGRFPVTVVSYEIEEKGKESGQAAVSVTFIRAAAGVSRELPAGFEGRTDRAAEKLEEAAVAEFEKTLVYTVDNTALAESFGDLERELAAAAGRIQGDAAVLNVMAGKTRNISGLIAQGIRAPRELAQALVAAAAGIVTGVMEIKNSAEDALAYFSWNNIKNILSQFLFWNGSSAGTGPFTVSKTATKEAVANLYRTVSLCTAARLIVRLEEPTYQQRKKYWELYERLESTVNREDPEVYQALRDLRIAAAGELSAYNPDMELARHISVPAPLLYLAHYLGCGHEKLRRLNRTPDSFVMEGDITYV